MVAARELSPPIVAETAGQPPRGHAAGEEAGEGEERARDREAARAAGGEAEEDDVAGHVGHEHVPEPQVGERIDDSGHDREDDQQRRQAVLRLCCAWPERPFDLPPGRRRDRPRAHGFRQSGRAGPLPAICSRAWKSAARSRRS